MRKQSCGVKTKMLHQYHLVSMSNFTSTPCHPVQANLFDSDDDNPITGHPGNPFISNPGNPFTQQQVRGNVPAQTTVDTDVTTIIGNTMSAVASEFKK